MNKKNYVAGFALAAIFGFGAVLAWNPAPGPHTTYTCMTAQGPMQVQDTDLGVTIDSTWITYSGEESKVRIAISQCVQLQRY